MRRALLVTLVGLVLVGCKRRLPAPAPPEPAATDPRAGAPVPAPQTGPRIVLTPRAAEQVRAFMKETGAKYLRASVVNGQYKLDLDPKSDPGDELLGVHDGIRIIADGDSAAQLPHGIAIDFLDEPGQKGFKFVSPEQAAPPDTTRTLAEARRGFRTTIARKDGRKRPPPVPPPGLFRLDRYDAPAGPSAAYLTPDPKDGRKHPAVIWITGGDCNSIDEGCWSEADPANDQSAAAYRMAGIAMMFPALRGGNDNPGVKEGFFGEVDDILAAADFLARQPFVDPQRLYLGGHSTGGTLVLLTAECSDRFRAVFSFGPVGDVRGYGPQYNPFVLSDPKELDLRAPGRWLHCVKSPTFVFEGTDGNVTDLRAMARTCTNPQVRFFEAKGSDHFAILAPVNRLVAGKILADTGPTCRLAFTEDEVTAAAAGR